MLAYTERKISRFFRARTAPTRQQCDRYAAELTKASSVMPAPVQGDHSYTVLCTVEDHIEVVSFRGPKHTISDVDILLARDVHGDLVPSITSHRRVGDRLDGWLHVYQMSYRSGMTLYQALRLSTEELRVTKSKHHCFMKELAKYFARGWRNPAVMDKQSLASSERITRQSLIELSEALYRFPYLREFVCKLQEKLPMLYSMGYSQVLLHGDLSLTNVLVEPTTFCISGLVGWSYSSTAPFGYEMGFMRKMAHIFNSDGLDFAYRDDLEKTFWAELFEQMGIIDLPTRSAIRYQAEDAMQIGLMTSNYVAMKTDGGPLQFMGVNGPGWMEVWLR